MGKVVRVGARVAAAMLGLLLALLLVSIAFNHLDQSLSASARAILAPPPDPYSSDDNIYLALVGFDAPAGEVIARAGEERLNENNRMRARILAQANAGAVIGPMSPPRALEFEGNIRWLQTPSVWSSAKGHGAQIAALLSANRELYQRYLSLHGLHGYFETGGAVDALSGFMALISLQRLFLANIASDIQSGSPPEQQAAVADLGQDLQLWKTVLDGTGGVLSKIMATQALHADLLLAGDMVTDPTRDLTFLRDEDDSLLAPFGAQSWKVGDAYEVDMRAAAPTLAAAARASGEGPWWQRANDWLGRQLFELHATEDLEAQRTEQLRALVDGNPATYWERREAYDAAVRRSARISLADFYNPVGKIVMSTAAAAAEETLAPRVYDVAALQRLVFLAYQVRRRGVPLAQLPQFMAQHPEWSTHPLGGKPFRWEPDSRRLAVVPVEEEAMRQRFSLTLHESSERREGR